MQQNTLQTAHAEIDEIFRSILPQYGMHVREGQIKLCHTMYDALSGKKIALCDAGVGIGKTIAYLIAIILLAKYQPEDRALSLYYGQSANLPFVISTSSIALQYAILEEYIPFLSKTLLERGIISEPFTGQIQKGKSNYVCRLRLDALLESPRAQKMKPERLSAFASLVREMDFDHVSNLSAFDRAKVCVPKQCPPDCVRKPFCLFKRYLQSCKENPALFQVCNHNYLIADALHVEKGYAPLLPHYRAIVIDEAHQFYPAVQDMCGWAASRERVAELYHNLRIARLNTEGNRLKNAMELLFDLFRWQSKQDELYRNNGETRQALKTVLRILQDIQIKAERLSGQPRLSALLHELTSTITAFFMRDERYFCFIEWDDVGNPCMRCVEKNYRHKLNRILWSRPFGMILTSGTLASGHDMRFFKERMGLSGNNRLTEAMVPSPFDYQNNCLLFFPERMPSCKSNTDFRHAAATEIANLIEKTAGHTLVLCTSYTELRELFHQVKAMDLPYPLFYMPRKGKHYLDAFKNSRNGVLFAAGSCWEGMDFPGDIVSSLIIVRLPFPRRDALHDGERQRYMDVRQFIKEVAVPEMQVKLRQGFGRGIRLTTDTCVVSILDSRAAPGGAHHKALLDALPECGSTRSLEFVEAFIQSKKDISYFMEDIEDV